MLILFGSLRFWVGLASQWQLLFPPAVGLTTLAAMSPEIRVGRMYVLCVICSPGWQNSWQLSLQQGGSGGSSPQVRRWNLGYILILAISVCCLRCPTLFIDTNPQHKQVAGHSDPLLFEAACVIDTLELSVAMEPVKDSCA